MVRHDKPSLRAAASRLNPRTAPRAARPPAFFAAAWRRAARAVASAALCLSLHTSTLSGARAQTPRARTQAPSQSAAQAQKPELVVQTGHSDTISSVTFSPDGRVLASGSWDNSIKLWDAATGTELRTLKGYTVPVRSVAFSPDGRTLAGSGNETVKLWDVQTGAELRTLKAQTAVFSLAFSPDGRTLATAENQTVRLWDAQTGAPLRVLKGHSGWVTAVA